MKHVSALGVEAITGKPYKPTTQGKNERFHQTLFRYLEQLQAQIDAFDHIYNTERTHQRLPGRVTPQMAWQATPKAEASRPKPEPPFSAETAARHLRRPKQTPRPTTGSRRNVIHVLIHQLSPKS